MQEQDLIDDYIVNFHKNLETLRINEQLLDFKIVVEDVVLEAHKLVLAASSDYFRALFAHRSLEAETNRIQFQNISKSAMEAILNFCYHRKIELNHENVQDILTAASILQIEAIQKICIKFIEYRIDRTNCLGVITLADRYNLTSLHDIALKYCLENFLAVEKEREFLDLDENILTTILSHDELNVGEEEQVFQAIVKWTQVDTKVRKLKMEKLMEHVRFALIEPLRLVSLTTHDLIKNSTKCRDLLDRAKNYLLLKDHPKVPELFDQLSTVRPRKSLLRQQRIYAVGGWRDEFKSIASAEMYDPRTNEWIELEPMATKRCGVGLTALGDSIYAVGGHDGEKYLNSVERYDVASKKWFRDVAEMRSGRTSMGVITYEGQIYAIGGQTGRGNGAATNRVEKYDPRSNTWTECARLNQKRLGVGVAVLDGYLYVMGGAESTKTFDSVERYDPVAGIWTMIEPMSTARKHLGSTSCDGKVYAIGGRNSDGLETAECYDPVAATWTPISPMSMKRAGIGVVELRGWIYVIGGQHGEVRLNTVEAYNPQTGTWETRCSMHDRRLGGGMTVYPSKRSKKSSRISEKLVFPST